MTVRQLLAKRDSQTDPALIMSQPFSPTTLVEAIRTLFEQNNYEVEGPLKIHGAEVDLKAVSRADIFAPPVFIEATVEYVRNEKYGKDLTKFILIREKMPDARLICVSSTGFTIDVVERAKETRIETLTYEDLFARFQRFGSYLKRICEDIDLVELDRLYQEAFFEDPLGKTHATAFLTEWSQQRTPDNPWIVVIGDYGSGKTALTRVLLRRWAEKCLVDPKLPIPFRIELRDFTRQFDARTLLHRFLDDNDLSFLRVEFIFSLIREGRVVLLLDGYDEMAQFMHARERRSCLAALAELSRDGAKGILTSRPNYFTVTEELNLLDALYTSLESDQQLSGTAASILDREHALDALLRQFIDRYERSLRDLDEAQTRNLVRSALHNDPEGQAAVLEVLEMAFRLTDEGANVSLSGKPVIVSYLLEVVDELKSGRFPSRNQNAKNPTSLSEWQVYALIVEKLMWRDYNRTPELAPIRRREFLRDLAVELSKKQSGSIEEDDFVELVRRTFQPELRRFPAEYREQELQRLFGDLRSSATLTRSGRAASPGWRFSHNSLREFLAAEHLVFSLREKNAKSARTKVSDAMQQFARALPLEDIERLLSSLAELVRSGAHGEVLGQYLALLWHAGIRLFLNAKEQDPIGKLMERVGGLPCGLQSIQLSRCSLSFMSKRAQLEHADFRDATFTDVSFTGAKLRRANFAGAILEGVSFKDADLREANFRGAMLIEADLTGSQLEGSIFAGLSGCSSIRTLEGTWEEKEAVGYFHFHGAQTDPIAPIAVCRHHPSWSIAEKIARKLCDGPSRQIRGLTQRGTASRDPEAADEFLQYLIKHSLAEIKLGRNEQVQLTAEGRPVLKAFADGDRLAPVLHEFFGLASQ